MPTKKELREQLKHIQSLQSDQLLAMLDEPITASCHKAVLNVLKQRGVDAGDRPVELVDEQTQTIELEQLLQSAVIDKPQHTGMGWVEGVSLAAGVGLTLLLWHGAKWVALGYGVVVAVVLYLVLRFFVRTWKELGR